MTRLEKSIADDDQYVLSNMNRWRDQLKLPDFEDQTAVEKETTKLQVDGQTFFVANFTGIGSSGGAMERGPLAGGAAASTNSRRRRQTAGASQTSRSH